MLSHSLTGNTVTWERVTVKIIEYLKIFIGLTLFRRLGKRFLSRESLVMAELLLL